MKRYIKSAISEPNLYDYDTLKTILEDPNLRPDVLVEMYKKYPNMCSKIAGHPNTPVDLLCRIADKLHARTSSMVDEESQILDALSLNPNSTDVVLSKVAHKGDSWTLRNIVKHPNTAYSTLSWISKNMNTSKEVRKLAKERMKG